MKVLVIDDKTDEREAGMRAAEAMGWECVTCDPTDKSPKLGEHWIQLINHVDAVVTDLMWGHSGHGEKPMGLLAVIHSLFMKKPVVICTNAKDHTNHHSEALSFIHDGYYTMSCSVAAFEGYRKKAFGWEENKDWENAMKLLVKQVDQ